jgi:hypothetical protein
LTGIPPRVAGAKGKNWKFSAADVHERKFWGDYMRAYEEAIGATASKHAPWFLVPADNKWFTRLVVAAAIVEAVEQLDLTYPKVDAEKNVRQCTRHWPVRHSAGPASTAEPLLRRQGHECLARADITLQRRYIDSLTVDAPRRARMSTTISVLGGVGLFLLGMSVMTTGLKALAGSGLRTTLSKAAATPLSGAFWGAFVTLIVQSRSRPPHYR